MAAKVKPWLSLGWLDKTDALVVRPLRPRVWLRVHAKPNLGLRLPGKRHAHKPNSWTLPAWLLK